MESNENVDPFLEEDYRRTGLGSPPPPPNETRPLRICGRYKGIVH